MSVQTQIGRIVGNINSAFDAVGIKGGTVPESKVSDNLEAAINSIPSGGSLPGGIRELATGSFTPTSDQSTLQTIDHNLGVIPDIFVLWADTGDTDIPAGYNGYFLSAFYFSSKYTTSDGTAFNCLNLAARVTGTNVMAARGQANAGSNNIMVVPVACSFKGGITHKWIACVFE